ncbi:MAG: hypothetical protein ACREQ9_24800 [Candidatus Binatia bacterium]
MVPIIGAGVGPIAWGAAAIPVSLTPFEILILVLELAFAAAAIAATRRVKRKAVALFGRSSRADSHAGFRDAA